MRLKQVNLFCEVIYPYLIYPVICPSVRIRVLLTQLGTLERHFSKRNEQLKASLYSVKNIRHYLSNSFSQTPEASLHFLMPIKTIWVTH
jgi:hypothetical protein